MSYLTYFVLIGLVGLTWIVVAYLIGNLIEKELRKQHRRKQIQATRAEMKRQYEGYMKALAHNKALVNELNKQ